MNWFNYKEKENLEEVKNYIDKFSKFNFINNENIYIFKGFFYKKEIKNENDLEKNSSDLNLSFNLPILKYSNE